MIDRSRDNLVRLTAVRGRVGLSRSTIYRKVAAGTFPAPISISVGCVAWYESEINDWVANPIGWTRGSE